MKKYKDYTLQNYLDVLSRKVPVPGGGSSAAFAAAMGAALVSMVANYSKGKNRSQKIESRIAKVLQQSERNRKRLLVLVDLDAQAYLGVVRTRGASDKVKRRALKIASDVPREVCQLCYRTIQLTPFLVKHGNPYLISDVIVAAEMLLAAFNSARVNVEVNS